MSDRIRISSWPSSCCRPKNIILRPQFFFFFLHFHFHDNDTRAYKDASNFQPFAEALGLSSAEEYVARKKGNSPSLELSEKMSKLRYESLVNKRPVHKVIVCPSSIRLPFPCQGSSSPEPSTPPMYRAVMAVHILITTQIRTLRTWHVGSWPLERITVFNYCNGLLYKVQPTGLQPIFQVEHASRGPA